MKFTRKLYSKRINNGILGSFYSCKIVKREGGYEKTQMKLIKLICK